MITRTRADADTTAYRARTAAVTDRMLRALLAVEELAAHRRAGRRWRAASARRRALRCDREIVEWFEAGQLPVVGMAEWEGYLDNVARAIDEYERGQ